MLTLDIETRSRADLRKCGTYAYAEDPSTDLLCLAAKEDDGETLWWASPTLYEQCKAPAGSLGGADTGVIQAMIDRNPAIVAHNAAFEREVLSHHGPFQVPAHKWRCTMAICGYYGVPQGLGQAAAALGMPEQKSGDGRIYIKRLSKPRSGGGFRGTVEDAKGMISYCVQDVDVEHALYRLLGPMPLEEHAVWQMDQEINRRGVRVDAGLTERWISALEDEGKRIHDEYRKASGGLTQSPRRRDELLSLLNDVIRANVQDLRKATVAEALKRDDLPEFARELLEYREQLSKTSVAKYNALRNYLCMDGRIRGLFRYCGAITGRWSGNGPQLQNLPRGSVKDTAQANEVMRKGGAEDVRLYYGDVFSVGSSCIRSMLTPAPGRAYVAADFSAIEGRGLAWLAGDEDALRVYRDGKDPYVVTASMVFGVPYAEVTRDQRQNGKVVELACQYRGWSGALKAWAELYGVEITEDQSVEWPARWRDSRPVIVRFWYGLEDAALTAVRTGKAVSYRGIGYRLNRRWLECRLPSGRSMWYYDPRIQPDEQREGKPQLTYMGVDSRTRKWTRIGTHGGKLCENVTQAICACFFRYGMAKVEAAGFPVVIHVHDETVSEVPDSADREGTLRRYEGLMSEAPPWAKGFPLQAKGWYGYYYRKG